MIRKFSALGVILGMFIPGLAIGQTIEEVVVTAQKREQSVNDIPIAISVFAGAELKERGLVSAEDIALMTPGLTVNATAATGVPNYTIRGVGFQNPYTASSSTVGLYFDEVSIPYTVMSRGLLFDIERVEVLKGPQGDLYGRNTTAGQMNFVSNKPTDEFQAGVTVGYASYNRVDAEGFVSGSLGDSIRGRVAARTVQSSDGWQESLSRPGDELGEQDTTAVRALFDIDLGERANLLLNVHHVDDQSDNRANTAYGVADGGVYLGLEDYVLPGGANFGEPIPWYNIGDNEAADWTNSYTNPITGTTWDLRPKRDNQTTGVSAKVNLELTDSITVTSITAYDQFDRVEAADWDGIPSNDSSNINTTDLSVFSQELRFSGGDDNLNWIAGAYYSKDDMDEYYHYFMSGSRFGSGSIPFGVLPFAISPIHELDTIYTQETESIAGFGHVEWRFADAWRLTLGGRYTDEKRRWSGCTYSASDNSLGALWNILFGASLQAGDCGTIDDDPDSPTNILAMLIAGTPSLGFQPLTRTIKTGRAMGRASIDYQFNDDVLLYFTVANGFKSGGFNGANSNSTRQLEPIRPEKLTSFEGGFKATLLEGSLQFNASGFYYDYKDKQESETAITFVGPIGGLGNVDQSEVIGAEVDLRWVPADTWDLRFTAAWLDTKIKEWETPDRALSAWPEPLVLMDNSGKELPQAPELQTSALVAKEWHFGNWVLDAAIDYSWSASTSGGESPVDATKSYGVGNGRLGFGSADGRWRALVWVRNFTDKYYFPSAYQGGNATLIRAPGMPRTAGVSISYNFGAY